jgi:glycosyltransferase involved in cell wall biosynthesis
MPAWPSNGAEGEGVAMRTVLFIAYNFPPAGGAGVQRSLKFVKYLTQFTWHPVVITTTANAYPVRDESLWADVPADVPVYRAKSYDINGLRPYFSRLKAGKVLSAINVALMLPDAALLWARLARSTVQKAIEEHKPSLIYSSSGPASAHLLASWTKTRFGLRWVADFRDPWSENRLIPYYPGYRTLNRRMEHSVLSRADRVITVTQPWANDLQRLSGARNQSVLVIENGYDEGDVAPLPPRQTERFTMTYTGTFSRLRRPDALVAAVDTLTSTGEIPVDEIRVVIAGKDTSKYIPHRSPYELRGYLDHSCLTELRQDSDLLLLIQDPSPENRGAFSGKIYEYLGSNRPTLAISHPENVAAQLIDRARAGRIVHHDPSEIAAAILHYYTCWKTRSFDYSPQWEIIQEYTRRNLTKRLAAEFDRLTDSDTDV